MIGPTIRKEGRSETPPLISGVPRALHNENLRAARLRKAD